MNPDTVFRKTEQGRQALRNRDAGLPRLLRFLLIATDGAKPASRLAKDYPQGDTDGMAAFKHLLELGLIEPIVAAYDEPPPAATVYTAGKYVHGMR